MSDEVCRPDWEISSLMCEIDGSNQTRSSNEFMFLSNSFDKLKFLYDHLNSMEDVNKVKTIERKQLTQNISSYLMRCDILTYGLFEVGDDCKQNEIKLNQEISQLKEQQNTQEVRLSYLKKLLLEEKTKREKLEDMNQKLKYTVNEQSEKMKSL